MTSPAVDRPGTPAEEALPSDHRRFPALDGLRALAAFAVIGTHVGFNSGKSIAGGPFGDTLSRLDIGVAVFFLLSGFLLYRPFALHLVQGRRLPSIRGFLARRVLRIFPAMWVMTAITLALLTTYVVHPVDWLSYLSLVQTYNHHDYDPNLTHLWTLSIEVSFYALLPVLAGLLARGRPTRRVAVRRQLVLLGSLAGLFVAFDVLTAHGVITDSQALLWLPGYLDWFAAGMFLALLTCTAGDELGRVGTTLHAWAAAPGHVFPFGRNDFRDQCPAARSAAKPCSGDDLGVDPAARALRRDRLLPPAAARARAAGGGASGPGLARWPRDGRPVLRHLPVARAADDLVAARGRLSAVLRPLLDAAGDDRCRLDGRGGPVVVRIRAPNPALRQAFRARGAVADEDRGERGHAEQLSEVAVRFDEQLQGRHARHHERTNHQGQGREP